MAKAKKASAGKLPKGAAGTVDTKTGKITIYGKDKKGQAARAKGDAGSHGKGSGAGS
jgi:hypothetical protein